MTDSDAVLFANEAFYTAFAGRDTKAMRALWAHDEACLCVHPGWAPLTGHQAICDSWDSILTGDPPDIVCAAPQVQMHGDVALVACWEGLGGDAWLVAVNGFVRRGRRWNMVLHQAGPASGRPPDDAPARTRRVN